VVPFVNPVTTHVVGGNEITVGPPDIKYPVIGRPPSDVGAVQLNVDCVFSLDVAVRLVGALGTVDGVALAVAEGGPGLLGFAFIAATLK
jgi:hypothetical protein